ncbi:MAG: polyprenyl synthetase family protein [Candidatus Margulisiibacteriota bacterium]|jgi:geranylgeranyl diphosphate synthase type I
MNKVEKELGKFKSRFDKLLKEYLQAKLEKCQRFDPRLVPYQKELNRLMLAGGKRIRPFLLCFAYQCYANRLPKKIIKLSLALELLQTFALIHDDIMDKADLRRGQPTVHRAIAKATRSKLGKNNAEHYGLSQAILLGDLAYSYCQEIVLEFNGSPGLTKEKQQFNKLYNTMTEEIVWGQQLDLKAASYQLFDMKLLNKIMAYKSGYYTIARPLQLGAVLGGASTKDVALLEKIGLNIGIAFQIRDDLLGLTGNARVTGKSNISDILEKKITLPLILALRGSEDNKFIIMTYYGKRVLTNKQAKEIKTIVTAKNVIRKLNEQCHSYADIANEYTDLLSINNNDKSLINELAAHLISRKT